MHGASTTSTLIIIQRKKVLRNEEQKRASSGAMLMISFQFLIQIVGETNNACLNKVSINLVPENWKSPSQAFAICFVDPFLFTIINLLVGYL